LDRHHRLDRGVAPAPGGAAREPPAVSQRPRHGLHDRRPGRHRARILPRRLAATVVDGGPAVSHAAGGPGLGDAPLPRAGSVAGARFRHRARPFARFLASRTRPGLDRARGRIARLRGPALAHGVHMSGMPELTAYALLVLVGFLPNELWRVLGLVAAR